MRFRYAICQPLVLIPDSKNPLIEGEQAIDHSYLSIFWGPQVTSPAIHPSLFIYFVYVILGQEMHPAIIICKKVRLAFAFLLFGLPKKAAQHESVKAGGETWSEKVTCWIHEPCGVGLIVAM